MLTHQSLATVNMAMLNLVHKGVLGGVKPSTSRPAAPVRPNTRLQARRREVETGISFPDLYDGLQDRVFGEGRFLPFSDSLVLVENVRTKDQVRERQL